jgi:hypothetical protein
MTVWMRFALGIELVGPRRRHESVRELNLWAERGGECLRFSMNANPNILLVSKKEFDGFAVLDPNILIPIYIDSRRESKRCSVSRTHSSRVRKKLHNVRCSGPSALLTSQPSPHTLHRPFSNAS